MDDRRFDNLTRTLAHGFSRRAAVKAAAAGMLGVLGLRLGADAQVSQIDCGNQACASNPSSCKSGCVCCIYTNAAGQVINSRCRPPGTCAPGSVASSTTTPAPTTTTARPTTTPAPTTTTTTAAPPITTTTTTTATPGCPAGTTNCNGVCCASPCQCLQRLDGGLSCVTNVQGRGCTGGDTGACDPGFACIGGICRGVCDPTATTSTTSVPCQPLGSGCFFGSDTCCQQPEPLSCDQIFDGSANDPPTLCCRPRGGTCSSFVDCCGGVSVGCINNRCGG